MALVKGPDTEPIPGYRLLAPLGQGGFGEVWTCVVPGGLRKAIKFVGGGAHGLQAESLQAEQEWQALQRIKDIRHPFLLALDRAEVIDGELVLVMELADKNLADLLKGYQDGGRPGVPRGELLGYLGEAAEVLDLINLQYNLQHLDVKPANLFLVNRHVKVGDFGLVKGLAEGGGAAAPGGLTPLYCAPEALKGNVDPRSDQYSLAIVYQELLTGQLPYTGRSFNEVLLRRATHPPDLGPLPEADRPIVAQALADDPAHRFASCTDFVQALAMAEASPPGDAARRPDRPSRLATGPTTTLSNLALRRDTLLAPLSGAAPPPVDGPGTFAGFRLVKNLSPGPLCEAWKVESPDRRARLLKLPCAHGDGSDLGRRRALDVLRALDHPGLVAVTPVEGGGGRIGLVSDLPGDTLADLFRQCRGAGQPGVPRRELLDTLAFVAQTLDDLYADHAVQHLCLNPRSLLVQDGRVLVADAAIAQLFFLATGQAVGPLNGRYAAPELFAGEASPTSDQYSLAVIYQEMLLGTFPFRNVPGRGKVTRPDLDLLPAPDRPAMLRALDADPGRRFSCCREFVDTLDGIGRGRVDRAVERVVLPPVVAAPTPGAAGPPPTLPPPRVAVETLFAASCAGRRVQQVGAMAFVLDPGRAVEHSCAVRLSRQLARFKLDGFLQQWNGEVIAAEGDRFVVHLPLTASFWQRCFGRQPGLRVEVRFGTPPTPGDATPLEIGIRPSECGEERGAEMLAAHGPTLLESLRTFLQVEPERRRLIRVSCTHPFGVFPVDADGSLRDPFVSQGKDVSLGGLAVVAPQEPGSQRLYVQSLVTPELAQIALLTKVVRARPAGQGRVELGLSFVEEAESWPP